MTGHRQLVAVHQTERRAVTESPCDEIDPTEFDATDAPPGSREKLRVLVERSERGLPLWHPLDRKVVIPPNNS